MKIAPETQSQKDVWTRPMEFELSKGLIGIEHATRFELLINDEELPFLWIRCTDRPELGFVVIEPAQFVSDYDVVLNDDDVASLDIQDADEAVLLNIVTIKNGSIEEATVNMIGPIVVNRRTFKGKQVIVSNYLKYSARHPILAESAVNS